MLLSAEQATALFVQPDLLAAQDYARQIANVLIRDVAPQARTLHCRVPAHLAAEVAQHLADVGYDVIRLERQRQPTGRLDISWPTPSPMPRDPKIPPMPGTAGFIREDPIPPDTWWRRELVALGWAAPDPYHLVEVEERLPFSEL